MQEGKTTSSNTEMQTEQIVCRIENKEESSKISLEKLISKQTQFALLLLVIFALSVTVIPRLMIDFTMSSYNDTTLANTHVTTSTNLIIAFVTVLYVWLTGNLVKTSKESIELSKEAIAQNKRSIELSKESIAQSQKQQQITDIEKRLEFFYVPAQSILKVVAEHLKEPDNSAKSIAIRKFKRGDELMSTTHKERAIIYTVEKLKEIEQYRFLAKEKTCRSFTKFVYEDESNENRLEFSNCVQEDVNDYLAKLYELKHEN